jgi:signal transduction histidine kinase
MALWATVSSIFAAFHDAAGGLAGAVAIGLVVWTVGRIRWGQRTLTVELTETTARLAAERDQRAKLAVTTERIRIARQLHGQVARGVVTMVVQAEAARNLLTHERSAAAAAIRAIEHSGRDALTQLRRILGVLRSTADAAPPLTVDAARPLSAPPQHDDTARLPEYVPA